MWSSSPVLLALFLGLSTAGPAVPSRYTEPIAANDNRHPAGKLEGGILTLQLEIRDGLLRPEADSGPGVPALAFAEVGQKLQVPGPLIRVPRGTEVRVSVRNPLPDSTLVVYGLHARPATGDTGLRIPAGKTREVRFKAGAPGTYYYWGTVTGGGIKRPWIDGQLNGALVVDPPKSSADDRIFLIGAWLRLGDTSFALPSGLEELMVINGKSWPHTEHLDYTRGDSVRWRVINATGLSHPMHLHGFYYRLESVGDWSSDRAYRGEERPLVVTHLMLPGQTMRIGWMPVREGNWLFHCHFPFHVSDHLVLHHEASAGSLHRMAGLVLGIRVAPGNGPPAVATSTQAPREIRLLAQSAPKRYGSLAGYGFAVQEGKAEPARDSIVIPGPALVLKRDEPVRITVVNHLREATAVHWHGVELQSFPDGVPGWSGSAGRIMPPIAPGDSFVAEFVPPRSGTFIYHTHSNEQLQMASGLYGALLVVDPEHPYDPRTDKLIVVGGAGPADSLPQFDYQSPGLINGSPDPPPIDLVAGKTYRFRLISINPDWRVVFSLMSDSAMVRWRPVAKDGADLPPSQRRLRPAWLLTGPGETADFEFTPATPGQLRLEVKTWLPGWIIPIVLQVSP